MTMNEETRSNTKEYSEQQIHDAEFERAEEQLSSKRLFRLAAELQDLVTTRRAATRRVTAPPNLTHYVE